MITAEELKAYPLFACLSQGWRQRVAETAGELYVATDEWIIREGETPSFFVLLRGVLVCEKDYGGANKARATYAPGDFYGEIPILLNSVAIASLRATEASRLLRIDPAQFKDMIASSPKCNEIVLEVMTKRLKFIHDHTQVNDSLRVRVFGSQYSAECREIRDFLSQNHIAYSWSDFDQVNRGTSHHHGEPFVIVDRSKVIGRPLGVRQVAEALGMNISPQKEIYDFVIVGGGPAGLAAAVSASSEGLRTLLIEKRGVGGQAACSSRIENYPGFPTGISGNELAAKALKQAVHFGAEIVMTREVTSIRPVPDGYFIDMEGECGVTATSILLSTGVQWRTLGVPGLRPLIGRGVLYGAARTEAHTVMGKTVFIVGAGNSAGQAAMFFSSYASSVTLLVRGNDIRHSMSQYLVDQLHNRPNIHIETATTLVSASGDTRLESICIMSAEGAMRRQADALFVMIGACAASNWMPDGLEKDGDGFVRTGRDVSIQHGDRNPFPLETSLPGIFCAGDIRHDSIKRVSSGMGEGSMAVAFVHQFLALQTAPELMLV